MWLIFYFEKKYCSRTARKENAFIIQVLTLKEVIKNLFSLLFLWIPNSYNESKLMRTHARNPLIYINSQYFWKWTNANPMKIFGQLVSHPKLLIEPIEPINNLGWLASCPKVFMGLALVHFQKYWLLRKTCF